MCDLKNRRCWTILPDLDTPFLQALAKMLETTPSLQRAIGYRIIQALVERGVIHQA